MNLTTTCKAALCFSILLSLVACKTITITQKELVDTKMQIHPIVSPDKNLLNTSYFPPAVQQDKEKIQILLKSMSDRENRTYTEFFKTHQSQMNAILLNDLIHEYLQSHPVTESEMMVYYNDHIDTYYQPSKYQTILVFTGDRRIALEYLDMVKAGEDFLKTAETMDRIEVVYNEWLSEKDLPEEIKTTVMKMNTGQFSGLLQVSNGYYIVKTIGIVKGYPIAFEKVKDELFVKVQAQKVQKYISLVLAENGYTDHP